MAVIDSNFVSKRSCQTKVSICQLQGFEVLRASGKFIVYAIILQNGHKATHIVGGNLST